MFTHLETCHHFSHPPSVLDCPLITSKLYLSAICSSNVFTLEILCVCVLSHVWLFETPWTVACQAPLSMGCWQEYWNGLPFPTPGDLPEPGIELASLMSPALAGGFFTTSATWEAWHYGYHMFNSVRNCQAVFKGAVPFYIPTCCVRVLVAPCIK